MKTAIIIASARQELADLALKSLARYAPDVVPILRRTAGRDPNEHARTIEDVRSWLRSDMEHVILFDDDAVVLSYEWLPTFRRYHKVGYEVIGGIRSRGYVEQVLIEGQFIPHAHCLSFTRKAFDEAATFFPRYEAGLGFVRYDTAVLACLGRRCKVLPYRDEGGVAEYFDPAGSREALWAHLGRGTSFAPRGRLRETIRRVAARCGSKRAQKILRHQARRAVYLQRMTERVCGSAPPTSG